MAQDRIAPEEPKDTKRVHGKAGPGLHLKLRSVLFEVLDGVQKGRRFRAEDDPVRIGSSTANSIVLQDETVSRNHAIITQCEEGLLLKDLDSTNGSFVEGHRVREVYLKPGSQVRLGNTTLSIETGVSDHTVLPLRSNSFAGMVGQSVAMRQLFALLEKVASRDTTVILCGETGTGKENCARAIHSASQRNAGPFVVLDCSALDRDLGGSELFGHEPGAFTGATGRRQGAFELAEGGTLFVDELGELPLDLQSKLLRVLEQREVKRLGGSKPIPVDCRIVAATHRDLQAMSKANRFREDLYFRFAQIVLTVPPLRERREDIPLLVDYFLERLGPSPTGQRYQLEPEALEVLQHAALTGNVRELRNILNRGCTMALGARISAANLGLAETPLPAERTAVPVKARSLSPREQIEQTEKTVIAEALARNGYHRARTARELGISVPTLRNRMRRYGLRPELHLGSDDTVD